MLTNTAYLYHTIRLVALRFFHSRPAQMSRRSARRKRGLLVEDKLSHSGSDELDSSDNDEHTVTPDRPANKQAPESLSYDWLTQNGTEWARGVFFVVGSRDCKYKECNVVMCIVPSWSGAGTEEPDYEE